MMDLKGLMPAYVMWGIISFAYSLLQHGCVALHCLASYVLGTANNTGLNPGEYVVCACLHVDVG